MEPKSVIIKRFCTSCSQASIDDGKGIMQPMGKQGKSRWICSGCVSRKKKEIYKIDFSNKGTAGRKPKPKEDYSLLDPIEDQEFLRAHFGQALTVAE